MLVEVANELPRSTVQRSEDRRGGHELAAIRGIEFVNLHIRKKENLTRLLTLRDEAKQRRGDGREQHESKEVKSEEAQERKREAPTAVPVAPAAAVAPINVVDPMDVGGGGQRAPEINSS